jgi:hypothetical protein
MVFSNGADQAGVTSATARPRAVTVRKTKALKRRKRKERRLKNDTMDNLFLTKAEA